MRALTAEIEQADEAEMPDETEANSSTKPDWRQLPQQVLLRHRFRINLMEFGRIAVTKRRKESFVDVRIVREVEGWAWTVRVTFTERGGYSQSTGTQPTLLQAVQQVCMREGMY